MKVFASIREQNHEFEITENAHSARIFKNGHEFNHELIHIGNNRYSLRVDGKSYLVQISGNNSHLEILIDGEYYPVQVEDERMRALRELMSKSKSASGEIGIAAPIPGLITKINVAEGDTVAAGDSLLVLEAMKMENDIKVHENGVVKKIAVQAGTPVEKDQLLLVISAE